MGHLPDFGSALHTPPVMFHAVRKHTQVIKNVECAYKTNGLHCKADNDPSGVFSFFCCHVRVVSPECSNTFAIETCNCPLMLLAALCSVATPCLAGVISQ